MRLDAPTHPGERQPVAMSADFLQRNRVFHYEATGRSIVVLTSERGANRVYEARDVRFERHLDDRRVVDGAGHVWLVGEQALEREGSSGVQLLRIPAQRAFWFGWYAQFPDTLLID